VPTPDGDDARVRWYRGNLHTHTTNSDGDESPEFVANGYDTNGYDFLAITDHNFVRNRKRFGAESSVWTPTFNNNHQPSLFGTIHLREAL